MNCTGLRKTSLNQSGLSLIELLVALAITGLLATGIMASISQVFSVNSGSNARMQAIKQLEVTIDRMCRDIQMAQEIAETDIASDPDPNIFMVLKWTDWDNADNIVKYSLNHTTHELVRQSTQDQLNPVAQNIESVSVENLDNGNWKITIVAAVSGYKSATESRTFEVQPRCGTKQ